MLKSRLSRVSITASTAAAVAALVAALLPMSAQATGNDNQRPVTVYFTRHAEKETSTESLGAATSAYELIYDGDDGTAIRTNQEPASKGKNRDDVCGESKCAEELNAFGLERAELLADWFRRVGVTRRLDKVLSSHKRRTFQTVDPTAVDAGLTVLQVPVDGTELEPEGTTASECPTLAEIASASPGDTLLVAGHSGTLYDIMGAGNDECAGLGLNTSNDRRFPKDEDGKVRDFGDVWKVVVFPNGRARLAYRVNLQPKRLSVSNFTR